jgi:hypothetical protein
MNMEEPKLNYTTNPRQIWWNWEEGLISTPERNLLYVLRAQGNPYGFCSVDMGILARDAFNTSVDKNYINKLLLSLRSKRYIWYKNRKGRRGSFQVHLDLWLLKEGNLKTLDKHFEQDAVRGTDAVETTTQTEVGTDNPQGSQRINEIRSQITQSLSGKK